MVFEKLRNETPFEMNQRVGKNWKENKIFEKSIENRPDDNRFVFYDGPIYANAHPGLHHLYAKEIKDAFCRYKTMKGYKVLRRMGLDTHGLPVEVNVEKKLGFQGKADIEAFGIDKFIEECRQTTDTCIDDVKKLTNMMGQFIDYDNPYATLKNEYIESEWWIINEMHKKGLIYQQNKVSPYCPRCGTDLSNFEVAQGYKDVSVNTVIAPFKVVDKDEYFLAWTTTPWTLMANLALCVNPDEDYVKAESMGYKFILAKALADNVLGEDYCIVETFKGKDLVGTKYEQLMPFVKVEGKAFEVVADSYVTMEDGTGIVHIAPAYGADDNRIASANGITFVNPVGLDGKYTEGPWAGRLVTDPELEIEIIKWLKENDKLFKKIKINHEYPHCWRCKQPLLYYAKPSWYLNNTKMQDKIIEANNKINWHPAFVGEKRFNNWLENMVDWNIGRSRYWGCPLPIWKCECGHFDVIGSIAELKEKALEEIKDEELDLHRPYVDNIHMRCSKCGKVMTREKDVMDVWFDAGSMPYAQYHYPFENKELFEKQFPADFIAEGIDQTRGWFYVLLVISTIISGESSYKNVLVNDLMLDANGKKMSKSLGNIVEPFTTIENYGADSVRFYLMNIGPVWTPIKFDHKALDEVVSKFYNTLKNTYTFFELYANTDNVDPRTYDVKYEELDEIDKWLLSKYNTLVKNVTDSYEEYDLNKVVKYLITFLNDDLSNWYIRRNRRRFWGSELDTSKKAVYKTTYDVLIGFLKLVAPIAPFITDDIYTNLTNEESIHLSDFPVYDESKVNEKIETRMDLVRDLISLGRNAREEAKIKVRQPISKAILDGKNEKLISDLVDLIKEELNVKEVVFEKDLTKFMTLEIKPNFKVCGKMFGKNINDYANKLLELNQEDINNLSKGNSVKVRFMDEDLEITPDMVDIRVNSKEGYDAAYLNDNFIVIDTTLNEDLILEGIAREIVSKVQNLRKDSGFEVENRITLYYDGDLDDVLSKFEEYIKKETLSLDIVKSTLDSETYDINGRDVKLKVERKEN
ncbi:MAG: isoleucine--tRNA ligase [Bacilli bacterium]|nr:isoleucine--tRNA ligase [Bacilli bacterium]